MVRRLFPIVWKGMVILSAILIVRPLLAEEPVTAPASKPPPPRLHAPPKTSEAKVDEQPRKPAAVDAPGNKTVVSLPLSVKLALMADARLAQFPIEAASEGQTVVLSGKVPSEAESALAAKLAMSVPGVTAVTNKLEVTKDIKQTINHKQDETITNYVKERFDRSTTLKTSGFDVKTEDGVVQLSGKTRFQVIALEAAETAKQVPGVRAVRTDAVRIEAGD